MTDVLDDGILGGCMGVGVDMLSGIEIIVMDLPSNCLDFVV